MSSRFAIGMAGLLGLVAASCSNSKTDYSYMFSETGGCSVDMTFTSLEAMCTALQSDSVNNNCQLAARMTFFAKHCPGTFTEVP